jgi:hypothetical protein
MLNNTLDSLLTTLDETYSRILRAILQFLTFSKRPLRIEEAVDVKKRRTTPRRHDNPKGTNV